MFENGSLWIVLIIIVVVVILAWYSNKRMEEKRVNEILAHRSEWGEEMCQWLIKKRVNPISHHTVGIMNNFQIWGQEACQKLLQKIITINDTVEMVRLALGEPTSVDDRVITERDIKFRWIYGVPRQGATYIWFKNGKVTKIKI